MNGLFVYSGPKAKQVESTLKSYMHSIGQKYSDDVRDPYYLVRLKLENWMKCDLGDIYTNKDLGFTVLVDGYFVSSRPHKKSEKLSKIAAQLFAEKGPNFVKGINGEFNIVIIDNKKSCLYVLNDRFGTRPVYWSRMGEQAYVTTGPRFLIDSHLIKPSLNQKLAATYLTFNKVRLGGETLFSEIDLLPGASILKIRGTQVSLSSYWEYRFNEDDSTKFSIPEAVHCFNEAVSQTIANHGERPCIALSGGLDSRALAAALTNFPNKDIGAMTMGLPGSDEVSLAERIAEASGLNFHYVPTIALDFVNNASSSFFYNDEIDLFVQGVWKRGCESIAGRYDMMMMGTNFDCTFGGHHLNDEIFKLRSYDGVVQAIVKNLALNHSPLGILNPTLEKDVQSVIKKDMIGLLKGLPQESFAAKYDLFYLKYALHRLNFVRLKILRYFVETSSPVYNYQFVDTLTKVSARNRAGHKMYREWLMQLSPALSRIPYQRTMLNPSIPVKYWKESNKIQHAIFDLNETIAAETQSDMQYRRYYSSWSEWSRRDMNFKKYLEKTILFKDSPIYEMGLVDFSRMGKVWECHLAGKKDFSQLLLHTCSMNGFLGRYFS